MSTLAFFAADTMNVTLHQVEDRLEGTQVRQLQFGPWKVDVPVTAVSDIITGKELTFWLTVGALQFYVVVREKEAWVMCLDSAILAGKTLTSNPVDMTVKQRIVELRSATKEVYHWEHEKWSTSR